MGPAASRKGCVSSPEVLGPDLAQSHHCAHQPVKMGVFCPWRDTLYSAMNGDQNPKHDPLSDAQACIVWHPAGCAPASELLRALSNKGMTLIDADDAHIAFAAACSTANSARRTILVLDKRDQLHDVDRICNALERFAPDVLIWSHEPGANPPLVPLVQPRASKPKRLEPATPKASSAAAPLRLVGQPEQSSANRSQQAGADNPADETKGLPVQRPATLNARDVLDADELDALLAGELGDRKH